MYEQFYGLSARPFDLTSNPRALFLTDKYREALSHVQYGIESRTGITVLVGEAGVGKTTMLRAAMENFGVNPAIVVLNNPSLRRSEFLQFLAHGFSLPPEASESKTTLMAQLQDKLLQLHRAQRIAALIVDEAQVIPSNLLHEIRLLANMEDGPHKLLPIVLAGQPELADVLNEPRFEPLKQRVAFRCSLDRLTLNETASYMAQRIKAAGGQCNQLFTRGAVVTIHERSRGIPRTINVIGNNALIAGFARDERPVGQKVALDVCDHLDIARSDPGNADDSSARPPSVIPGSRELPESRDRSELVEQVLSRRRV